MDPLSNLPKLGSGAMGSVYLYKHNGQEFAIKTISKAITARPQIKESFYKELSMLNELKHNNIIKLLKVQEDDNWHYLTLEYCNGNSLRHCLKSYMKKYKKPFSEKIVQYLMKQIVEGLKCIHEHDIIHRDMKLANILVKFYSNEDLKNLDMLKVHLKISDFGISIKAKTAYTLIGTVAYLDPIILKKMNERNDLKNSDGYDKSADIWSLGALCYEMVTGHYVFNGRNQKDFFNKVELGNYSLPKNLSNELFSFLFGMLQYDPKKRLNIEQISQHSFLKNNVEDFTKIDLDLNVNIKNNQTINKILIDYETKLSIINKYLNLDESSIKINEVPDFQKGNQFNKFNEGQENKQIDKININKNQNKMNNNSNTSKNKNSNNNLNEINRFNNNNLNINSFYPNNIMYNNNSNMNQTVQVPYKNMPQQVRLHPYYPQTFNV